MKTLKTSLLLIALLIISSNVSGANDKPKSISQKIQSVLSTAKQLKTTSTTEKVTVCFVVNDDGNVTEVNAKTKNLDIKKHIETQFLNLNLCGLQPCVTNTIDVNFVQH